MFRSISQRLQRRLERLRTDQTHILLAQKLVALFIAETYQSNLAHEVVYDSQSQELSITTTSKTVASDLLLRTPQLSALLRKHGLVVKRLQIR